MRRSVWFVLAYAATAVAKPSASKVGPGSCPATMVRIPTADTSFCIDRTEVTVAAYAKCVAASACPPAPVTVNASWVKPDDAKIWAQWCNGNRADRANHPINCVDWDDARAYCDWAGGRLPTGAEWQRAAQGEDGRTFPWGDHAPTAQLANVCDEQAVKLVRAAGLAAMPAMFEGDDGFATTAPVGSFTAGASPYGVLDMAGNVWEWVADGRDGERAYRGGGWLTYEVENISTEHARFDVPALRLNALGFRCAR
ncbi:MAG TPA: SUMF1/EgtB/PvdO family nonheme iron enzyme [Kofleriaceae bacterium]|nr:SUMF1/EgtB/PvdO family nonheme iron enzyme [Kofleriaceae bacterium]